MLKSSLNIVIIGASKGIGAALVQRFSKNENHQIIGVSRSFSGKTRTNNITFSHLDLTSSTLKKDIELLIAEIDRIDILINNAGHIVVKPFLELTKDDIQTCYQVNVIAVMETIQACMSKLVAGSHIVNISSMGGFQGSAKFAGLAAYSTSKAAVVSLTELLAEELKETGIKINCLCLGAVQTEMLATAFPGYEAPLSAEEMAEFIADFALNAGRFMNGKVIPVALSVP